MKRDLTGVVILFCLVIVLTVSIISIDYRVQRLEKVGLRLSEIVLVNQKAIMSLQSVYLDNN